jgi:hypothetical protein
MTLTSSFAIQSSRLQAQCQYPDTDYMAQLGHIIDLKYPYFEPFYGLLH